MKQKHVREETLRTGLRIIVLRVNLTYLKNYTNCRAYGWWKTGHWPLVGSFPFKLHHGLNEAVDMWVNDHHLPLHHPPGLPAHSLSGSTTCSDKLGPLTNDRN